MVQALPERASAVVIGGGVIGASVAYHLAKLGWSEVVLLERRQFACGTSWHAAGLVGTMRASESHARLCEYSMRLIHELEEETGQSTGFRRVGSLSIAHSEVRFEELKRVAAMNNAFGVTRVDIVGVEEMRSLYPLLEPRGLLGGSWVAQDGHASPVDVVTAFIKGARQHGATCLEGVKVLDIHRSNGRVSGVATDHGDIRAEFVANAAGLWSRDLGRLAGVNVPLHACEHYYAHTEKLDDLPSDLPVMRDYDRCAYYREDAGSLLVGAFEPNAIALPMEAIPEDFCFDELPGHAEEQLMPVLEDAMERVPMLKNVGWRRFFCGPESFTPDDQFHVGEAPELRNFYVACGLNSVGIQTSGGIGKACAEWMHAGHPPLDLWGNDIRRMYSFQGTTRYLRERVSETLGLLYANHYPFRQYETARHVRHSPIHERLAAQNACFGEAAGWERPNWFAPEGVEPRYRYSFGKQNWFEYSAAEHRAAREGVALFDQSSFSKYLIQGNDACKVLQRICTADVDVEPGRIVYTHWLNARGGIEADLTVTRLAENRYMVVSGAAVTNRDLDWLSRHVPDDAHCVFTDITAAWAVLGVMGPGSRALLEQITSADLSNDAFPFATTRDVEIGCAVGRAFRVSYVGELGWELYVPSDQARHAYDVLMEAGAGHGLVPAGMHALDSCRIEKKFVHFGHDIADEDSPVEAGMRFVCHFDKPVQFIGRDAVLAQIDAGKREKRLVQFLLQDPDAMLYHHEPILRDGLTVGYLTSGNYGHTLGGSVGLGYVRCEDGVDADYIASGSWQIDVAGVPIAATASLRALYDPRGERARS
ncbi:MAG: FAD-dependent oxidoreductase [Gammaproteobacteria bacterium]|nr:FAD-dependent oxidoreductase [Gammaproteobacteria bacterium]NIM71884.1 FAD-dependent oxidoreductase [Gammaproteobacteria bacterium]NIN38006.1 FAD-dependent oxidoreductase [Gammaproteobacteria bacterium]NIO23640.1 FAD-dependent oxidoreductase [Gammaproteobacteria bacterium]NIO64256.1 FAD-dependent oxidoreductase [Gammaproteobacteria bacterium]